MKAEISCITLCYPRISGAEDLWDPSGSDEMKICIATDTCLTPMIFNCSLDLVLRFGLILNKHISKGAYEAKGENTRRDC